MVSDRHWETLFPRGSCVDLALHVTCGYVENVRVTFTIALLLRRERNPETELQIHVGHFQALPSLQPVECQKAYHYSTNYYMYLTCICTYMYTVCIVHVYLCIYKYMYSVHAHEQRTLQCIRKRRKKEGQHTVHPNSPYTSVHVHVHILFGSPRCVCWSGESGAAGSGWSGDSETAGSGCWPWEPGALGTPFSGDWRPHPHPH